MAYLTNVSPFDGLEGMVASANSVAGTPVELRKHPMPTHWDNPYYNPKDKRIRDSWSLFVDKTSNLSEFWRAYRAAEERLKKGKGK